MKSRAHRSVSRIAATLSAAALGVLCFAGLAAAAPATPAVPEGGGGPAVWLAASVQGTRVGAPVTLTATGNLTAGQTPYWITIYSETTGAELAACPVGTTCSARVTQSQIGSQSFEAFIGDDVIAYGHPGFVLVSSCEVSVLWWYCARCTG